MIYNSQAVVFPDGDSQEIQHKLNINDIVDLNGIQLRLPLPTAKMIAYRVYRISTKKTRNDEIREYHLDLLSRDDMQDLG